MAANRDPGGEDVVRSELRPASASRPISNAVVASRLTGGSDGTTSRDEEQERSDQGSR